MKFVIVLSAVILAVSAKPGFITPYAVIPVAAVSSQFHAQDELGQYSYGYSNPLSTKSEIKTADGVTQGGYSYVDAEGKLQTVQYVADPVNGFRVAATNLPEAPVPEKVTPVEAPQPVQDTPEVTEAKAKHLEAVKEAEKIEHEEIKEEKAVVAPVVAYAAPAFAYTPYTYPAGHAYSYTTYNYPYFHQIHPFAYSAPVYTHYAYTAPQIPAVPAETPEVAKARAEHLAAHEEAKSRNA